MCQSELITWKSALNEEIGVNCELIGSNYWIELIRNSKPHFFLRTYDPKVKCQVDYGADSWSEVTLLHGALPTAYQHGGSHPPSVVLRQTSPQQERDCSDHYSPRSAISINGYQHPAVPTPVNSARDGNLREKANISNALISASPSQRGAIHHRNWACQRLVSAKNTRAGGSKIP